MRGEGTGELKHQITFYLEKKKKKKKSWWNRRRHAHEYVLPPSPIDDQYPCKESPLAMHSHWLTTIKLLPKYGFSGTLEVVGLVFCLWCSLFLVAFVLFLFFLFVYFFRACPLVTLSRRHSDTKTLPPYPPNSIFSQRDVFILLIPNPFSMGCVFSMQ